MSAAGSQEPLRLEVREWLANNVEPGWRAAMTNTGQDVFFAAQKAWFAKLVSAG